MDRLVEQVDKTSSTVHDVLDDAAWRTAGFWFGVERFARLMGERFATYPVIIWHEGRLIWHYDKYRSN